MINPPLAYHVAITSGLDHEGLYYGRTLDTFIREHDMMREQIAGLVASAAVLGMPDSGRRGSLNVTAAIGELYRHVRAFTRQWEFHSYQEDQILFPVLIKYMSIDSVPITAMEEEHRQIRTALAKFSEQVMASTPSSNPAAVLPAAELAIEAFRLITDHFDKEERVLFPMVQTMLTERDMELLDKKLEAITMIASELTVLEVAAAYPASVELFQRYGISYCCGGGKTLSEAAGSAGIAEETLLEELRSVCRNRWTEPAAEWDEIGLSELTAYLADMHHSYLKSELPLLVELSGKIVRKHGERYPSMEAVHERIGELEGLLGRQMEAEEEQLFPLVREYEASRSSTALERIVRLHPAFEADNRTTSQILSEIRGLTDNYAVPEKACRSVAMTYRKLQELEAELYIHIHLENNLLFPRLAQ
ncbi:hypothetical protein DNH61_24260 [Paenibacillus sambharensis]|uniref:Hemerythrin-like domain-containing protein n=1 Tax=Paenibacillus sambharensis TaxID=1803190 RepID=A0A2W1LDM7_9BACL|nr:DUF542 domain-containing protein [Paenibacillus sambharensis]PZD93165.1 hypothetical protein DNH61_24260 [Paenibacillus sambharensis]